MGLAQITAEALCVLGLRVMVSKRSRRLGRSSRLLGTWRDLSNVALTIRCVSSVGVVNATKAITLALRLEFAW